MLSLFFAEMEKNEKASKEERKRIKADADFFRSMFHCDLTQLLWWQANKKNVQSLEDYIRNEVYKLCSDEEIKRGIKFLAFFNQVYSVKIAIFSESIPKKS